MSREREFDWTVDDESELAYTLVQDWGALHVTRSADKAFGIVPLVVVDQYEAGTQCVQDILDTEGLHIVLASDEDADPTKSTSSEQAGITSIYQLGKTGLSGTVEYIGDRKLLAESKSQLLAQIEAARLDGMSEFTGLHGEKPEEMLDNDLPQLLLHELVNVFSTDYAVQLSLKMESHRNKALLSTLKRQAGFTALIAAGYTSLMTNAYEANLPFVPGITAGTVALGGAFAMYASVRAHLDLTGISEQTIRAMAASQADHVSTSIHDAFCANVFDQRNSHTAD